MRSVELLTSFWQTRCKILLRWKMKHFTMWGVWKSLLHSDRRFVKSFCVEKWKIYHVRSMELLTSFWQTRCKIFLRWEMRNFTMLRSIEHLTSFWQTLCKIFLRWEMRNFTMLRSMEHLTSFWQTLCKILLRWKMKHFTMWGVWKSLLHFNRRFVKSFCVEKWEISPCEEYGTPYFILTDAL